MADHYLSLIDPDDPDSFLVAADWLEEQERFDEAVAVRSPPNSPDDFVNSYLYGYGSGRGDKYDSGIGYAYLREEIYKLGSEYGTGESYSQCYREECRYLTYLRVFIEVEPMDELIVGQPYLWMTGGGWMWIGRFVRREGLFGAVVSDPVNICRTGGTPWDELCQGAGRAQATFRRWPQATDSGTPFPYAVPLARWEGELPKTSTSTS